MQPTLLSTGADWRDAWNRNWARPDLRSVRVAVAYCSRNGAAEVVERWENSGVPVEFLVGLNDGVTDFDAREKLWDWSKNADVEVRGTLKTSGRFHPKIYVFERADEIRVLLGSVNLTHSAFHQNSEASLELVLSRDETLWHHLKAQLDEWWHDGEELARPSIEERLIKLMNEGITVQIEVQTAALHAFFKEDIFDIGDNRFAQSGAVTMQRLNFSNLCLVSQACAEEIAKLRAQLHSALHKIAIRASENWFVARSAYPDWKHEYESGKAALARKLAPFQTEQGRALQREIWLRELPEQIERAWRKFHGLDKPLEPQRLQRIIELASQQFDQKAARFPETVRLLVTQVPHPFSTPLDYLGDKPMEADLHLLALEQKESELRIWASALVWETRTEIVSRVRGVLNPNSTTRHKERLKYRLEQLNSLEDAWAQHALNVLQKGAPEDYKRVRDRALNQLEQAQSWQSSAVPMQQVLAEFAAALGWDAQLST